MDINHKIINQINNDVYTIQTLLSLNVFEDPSKTILANAVLTKIMICLRDLVFKSEKFAKRVSFTDDISVDASMGINDITDLIKFIRDSLCHSESKNSIYNKHLEFNFVIISGQNSMSFDLGKKVNIQSSYTDDLCFVFGKQKIYLNRHIIRAFDECKKNLSQFVFIH